MKNKFVDVKEIGCLNFKVPREYFDAWKMYRLMYHKRIVEEYGDADLNSAFLYLFTHFCEKEGLDMALKLIKEYEDSHFNVKKELIKIDKEIDMALEA